VLLSRSDLVLWHKAAVSKVEISRRSKPLT